MEEIVTVNGQEYKLNTIIKLTQAQRNDVIRQLSTQTVKCSSCGDNNSSRISTLATGCPPSAIKTGTLKTFQCVASGGNGTYNYTLTIGSTVYNSPVGTGASWNQSHTFNTAGTITPVSLRVVDTCTGTTLFATDSCPSGIIVQNSAVNVINVTGCPSSIVIGATCTLSATCTDQFGGAISCVTTWTSLNPTIAIVNSSTGVVTGVSTGTANIYATSGGVNSPNKSVTVSTIPCTTPTCSFTIA